jgi:enterochelin esterase-like enzyme
MSLPLERLALPERLEHAAKTMAPAYLRRRLTRTATPFLDGPTATFAYVGNAEAVRVMHFMSRFPQIPPMERLEGTELWHVTVELPPRCRIEYQLEVTWPDRTSWIVDPLNQRTAHDPFGANSVAHGPGYIDPPWCSPSVDASPGTVESVEVQSSAFGGTRTMSVYLPAGFPRPEPYPAVFLHDGSDLIEYAALTTVLDNLIGARAVEPLVALLVDPVERNREYMALPEHGRFIVDDLLPHAISEFAISTDAEDRVIGGASLGAVAALSTAWRHPGVFGSLVLLSGTFITATGGPWNRSEELQPAIDFVRAFTKQPGTPAKRAWVACGGFEALADDNQRFLPVLEKSEMKVSYTEPPDGHHWQNWRNNLGEALMALRPPRDNG